MKVTRVCCQGCGADLELSEDVRFVTCNFCGSRLEIVHDETVTHSKLLEKIGRQTDEMADDLKVIRLQNELEQLDREWESTRQSLMVADKHGNRSEPSAAGSVVGGVVMIVAGIAWTGFAASMGAPGFFPLFGLLFIGFALFTMIRGASNATQLGSSRSQMQQRRGRLLAELERAKRGR